MNVHRIELRNFRSYEHADVTLPDGTTALIGPNGAGKSSLLVAIDVGLFGAPSLEPFLRRGADRLELTLHLEHDDQQYRVRRGWRGRSSLDFEKLTVGVGEWIPLTLETQAKTQELIEGTLGLTRATFRASAYLAQGDAAALTSASPSDRMEILRNTIGGLELYEAAHARAKLLLREARENTAKLEGAAEGLGSAVAELPQVRQENDSLAEQVLHAREECDLADLAEASAAGRLADARHRVAELRALDAEHKAAESRLAALEQQALDAQRAQVVLEKTALQEEAFAAGARKEATYAAYVEALEQQVLDHERAKHAYESAAEERMNLVARAEWHRLAAEKLRDAALADEKAGPGERECRECGQILGKLALARSIGHRLEQANDHMAHCHDHEQKAAAVEVGESPEPPPADEQITARAALDAARNDRMQLGVIRERNARLRETVERVESDEFRRAFEEARVSTAAAQAAHEAADADGAPDTATLERTAGQATRNATLARSRLSAVEREHAVAQHKLEKLLEAEVKLADVVVEIREAEHAAAVLEVVADMFAPTGIPLLVIEGAVPMVEERAQGVLERLGGQTAGCRVELRTQRARKADGALRDTLDIVIHTPAGDAVPYEAWSGGERMRLDLALRVGLAQLLLVHGANVELFAVDEPDGLDAQGRAALVDVIEDMADRFGFTKVLLISHDDSLRDALPQAIEVARSEGGTSKVIAA